MLVTTLSAFALDFTDYRKVTLGSYTPTESNDAKLSVTDNGDGTYNVTFNDIINKDGFYTDNYGTFTFSNVSGSKSGDVTTVTATDVTGTVSGGTYNITEFTKGNLSLKFKDGKAYATMTATCRVFYSNYTFDVVFGTDEGFGGGSTGGGETGGETSSIVTVKENFQSTEGSSWGENVTIDWNTQKLVASINLANTGSDKGFLGVTKKGQTAGWNNYGIIFYNTNGSTVQGYAPGQPNNANTDQVTKGEDPVRFEISKEGGVKCQGNVVISASNIAHLTNQSEIVVGAADKPAGALYNYIKVVPLDWTETTEPTEPEVTVVATKKFDAIDYSNTWSQAGTANVTFEEMSDETVKMKFATDGINISANALTKGTDANNRTTYTGEAVNDAMSTLTYTIKAVVYTEGTKEKLYMTMVANSGVTFTVGTDPDYVAPEPPAGESTIVENWKSTEGTSWSHDVTIDWNTQKLVVSVNLASTGSDKGFLGVTKQGNSAGWNNDGIIFYNVDASTVQGYAPGQYDNGNTHYITKGEDPVRFEISKDGGVKCQGNVVISSALIAHLTNQSNIVVGAADKVAGALYNYIKVVSLDWKETTEPEVTVKDEKTFNEALYMNEQKFADAKVVVKEMSDETVNMSLQFNGNEYTSTELTKGTDEKNRTTYTGKVSKDSQTYDVAAVVYEKDNTARLYMTMTATGVTFVVGENPDVVTPEVTEVSNKTYTKNLRILDGETTVVEEAEANVNIVKYSDESYKVTLKNVNMLNKTQDLVFVGKALIEEAPTEATEPLTIIVKSDEATTAFFGEEMNGTFEITEVSAEEIKMGFVLNNTSSEYQGEFNYTEEEEPEVYTSNLHIYDAAAPETDLFQADQAKVEFLATETGEFKLTLKDVTLNEKKSDLVFTGTLPTPQPGGQDPLAEEGEGEVTPAEPAMVLNATADEATTNFFGVATYPTAVFNVSYDKNDNFMMTFTITAGAKNYGGEFNYEKKNPETPDVTVEVEKTFTDSFSLNNVSLGNAKVTIKEMSDKTINMVFTFGTNDFTSTDLVKGTDDKNRTTYTGTISIGGVECVVNGVVYTKDNAEKLYMTLVSTTSGTYVFGTEPTDTPEPPVVEEYPINFDKDANSTHNSRVLNSFSLQQTGKDKQTKSVKTSKAAYEDHTADEPFTVEAGSELTASFDYTGEWMHSFVYIDFDNDGQFSYKEGQWDQTGTDLVAFSFYSLDSNPKNDASGYNSVGDELTGDARNTYAAPSFKAPAKAGEYRIRFKIDWNCILPGGSSSILSDGGGVWDATLKVVEPVVDGISSINAEVANGEAQLFTIDGVKLNKLQKGLNIVRTADGKVKKVLVK